jgi:hypothetical protein
MKLKALWIAAAALAVTAVLTMGLAACGSVHIATDAYEPNNDLDTATVLTPGTALQAAISRGGQSGDTDVFRCDMPIAGGTGGFRLEVRSFQPGDLNVEVGISLPEGWEGITWPGWNPTRSGNSIVVEGQADHGTLLVFVSGRKAAAYSLELSGR